MSMGNRIAELANVPGTVTAELIIFQDDDPGYQAVDAAGSSHNVGISLAEFRTYLGGRRA